MQRGPEIALNPAMEERRGPIASKHADQFRCMGADCEDTCCSGWAVSIDSKTHAKLHGLVDSPLRVLIEERVFVNPQSASDDDFARVKLDPTGRCPFLSEQRLCNIQIEHGVETLSTTCASYPRATRRIEGLAETSLHLSCPAAARTVLLDRNFLPRQESSDERRKQYLGFAAEAARLAPADGNPSQYFWAVREFTVLLLADRDYPLWQRLFVLGLFCNSLDSAPISDVPQLLRSYAEIMGNGTLREAMDRIPPAPGEQFSLVVKLFRSRFGLQQLPARLEECLEDWLTGLGCEDSTLIADLAARAGQVGAQHLEPFLAEHEHLLENYLLNAVVRRRFPYGDEVPPQATAGQTTESPAAGGPAVEFALLALRLAVVKGLMVGAAGRYKQDFSPDHAVKIVQSVAKATEHSAIARASMVGRIQAENLTRPEALAMMLRN